MKRIAIIILAAGVLAAGGAWADEHSSMHEMMKKAGGPKPDDRVELKLPDTMKVMQKRMMRQHLSTVGEITGAIAAGDLQKASQLAKDRLGWSPAEEARCATVGEITGEKDFLTLGMAVHKSADELADAAKAGDRDKALSHLSALIRNCNACHERFRH